MTPKYVLHADRPPEAEDGRPCYILTEPPLEKAARTPIGGLTPAGYRVKLVGGRREYVKEERARPKARAQLSLFDQQRKPEKKELPPEPEPQELPTIETILASVRFPKPDPKKPGYNWRVEKYYKGTQWARDLLPGYRQRETRGHDDTTDAEAKLYAFESMARRKLVRSPTDPFWQGAKDLAVEAIRQASVARSRRAQALVKPEKQFVAKVGEPEPPAEPAPKPVAEPRPEVRFTIGQGGGVEYEEPAPAEPKPAEPGWERMPDVPGIEALAVAPVGTHYTWQEREGNQRYEATKYDPDRWLYGYEGEPMETVRDRALQQNMRGVDAQGIRRKVDAQEVRRAQDRADRAREAASARAARQERERRELREEPTPAPEGKRETPEPEPKFVAKVGGKRGRGSRRQHVEVGEHVFGSRADLAIPRTSSDLARLTPAEQAKYVTKTKLMPKLDVDEQLARGRPPGYVVLRDAVEKCVATKPPADSLLARQAFMDGVDFLSKSMEKCETADDIHNFLVEWHHLTKGQKLERVATEDELYQERDRYLAKKIERHVEAAAPAQREAVRQRLQEEYFPVPREDYLAAKQMYAKSWEDMRELYEREKARGMSLAGDDPEVMEIRGRQEQSRKVVSAYERAGGPRNNAWAEMLTGNKYGDVSFHERGGQVHVYLPDPEIQHVKLTRGAEEAAKANPYAFNGAMLGKRFAQLIGYSDPLYKPPKVYKDAHRLRRTWESRDVPDDQQVEELLQHLEGKKRKTRTGTRGYRWQKEVTGKPERLGGLPVEHADARELQREFGFKNIQFGNWVTDDDAQSHLLSAHGALRDLREVTGIDASQVTFNGRLSLGIGARGSGGKGAAAAHYEPGQEIINLTKFAGGGTLAHEWGHALDNILAKHANPGSTAAHLFMTDRTYGQAPTTLRQAYDRVMGRIMWADHETARKAQRYQELDDRYKKNWRDLDPEERKEYGVLARDVKNWRRSNYWTTSAGMALGDNNYYTRPHELFARAFEAWAQDQLEDQGRRNSYLVDGTRDTPTLMGVKIPWDAHPYPEIGTDERREINEAMGQLMAVINDGRHLEKALRYLARIG